MAHGFLTPTPVSGDNFWKNLRTVYKGLRDLYNLYDTGNKILKANVRELDPKQIAAGQQKALPGANQKALAAAPATKMLGAGAGSLAKRDGGLTTSAEGGLATNNRPELPPGGPRLGATGGIAGKGGTFTTIPGVASAGLNAENFFQKAQTGVGSSGEYLTKAQRIADFRKSQEMRSASAGAPPIVGDSGADIVAAVNRNTQMIVSLVDAVKSQTATEIQTSEKQMQAQETMMLRAAAKQKESDLEQGSDLSGFMTPENFAKRKDNEEKKKDNQKGSKLKEFFRGPNPFKQPEGGGCGCSPILGGPGGGFGGGGGGLPIPDFVEQKRDMMGRPSRLGGGASVMRRGGGARALTRAATKIGGKGLGKAVGKGLAKKIPGVGVIAGGAFAAERAMKGDWLGAGGELLSGIASIIPGIGTGVSTAIDAGLAARDAGLTPFAKGGIITQPTAGLVGEAGNEGIFPLEGPKGRKVFEMFGQGMIDAQIENRREFSKIQSAGLKQYYENEGGFKKMGEGLKGFFATLAGGIASLLGGNANAATGPGGPGSGDYFGDPTVTGDEKEYLMRLMIAEAGNQGDIGMAAVGRSVLNRAGLIQSGSVGAGTFNAKSGSIMDVINASGQYQPVAQGKLKRELSADERKRAEAALAIAMNQADMRGRLEAKGLKSDQVNKLMAATGFRAGYAFDDPSQNVNVTKLGDHYFNTAGNKDLKVAGAVKMHSPAPHASGNAVFGETGNVSNAKGYVHGHFQTNTGSKADLVNDVAPVVRGLLNSGITDVSITSGEQFRKNMSDAEIRSLIEKGISKHTHSGDGRSVDIFVPKGTKVPFPLSDVKNTGGRGGVTGILPGSGKVWVGHLDPRSKSGGAKPKPTSEMANQPGAVSPLFQRNNPATSAAPATPSPLFNMSAANANTGTNMMATSQQVAMASAGSGAAPTVINNYYTAAGGAGGGVNGNNVGPGIGMESTGLPILSQLALAARA